MARNLPLRQHNGKTDKQMKPISYQLTPTNGWDAFTKSEHSALLDHIWAHLPIGDDDNQWFYYNFTSTTSLFDSDNQPSGSLFIEYDKTGENVEDIQIHFGGSASHHATELEALMRYLCRTFGLKKEIMTEHCA
jgi:hypothetical protein